MRKKINIWMILFVIAINFSCENKDDFLNKQPLGDYSETAVWSDPNLIETFVNTMYRNALGFPFSIERLSDYVDESHFTPDWDVTNFNKSLMTSDGLQGWSVDWATPHTMHFRWDPLYANVRRTNIFFSKIGGVKSDNQAMVDRLKGEAFFMRAWTYFYLTNLYGGVPIILKAYGLNDEFEAPRNTYEECINFIVGQIDSAALYLPENASVKGRVYKGAALAFKSRILLYAASDLHNPQKNSEVASGFSKPDLLGYVGGDAAARWLAAKNAAKAVIDLGKFDLYKKDPAPGDSIAQNFVEFFISKGTEEDILLQFFTPKTDEDWQGYNPALYSGPNGYHNWGNNCPLGELVDDYEMKDGSVFGWDNPVHKANPYVNRDARLYATILYEGVQWRVRPSDALKIDPFSRIQVGHVYDLSGKMIKAGLDTREGPIEDWNGGKTGYYLRKFNDPNIDPQYVKQDVPFKHIRYAEILMNYAEACNELGEDVEARNYLNMIRKRAGQPEIAASVTGDALRKAIRHERRIEFAYEDHRFWDVRRWLIAEPSYVQTHGVSVRYVTAGPVDSYRKPDGSTWGDPIFAEKEVPGDARAFNKKIYFFPIMRDEMNKNTKLIQNPGY
jgi:hypothetical protein